MRCPDIEPRTSSSTIDIPTNKYQPVVDHVAILFPIYVNIYTFHISGLSCRYQRLKEEVSLSIHTVTGTVGQIGTNPQYFSKTLPTSECQ
jgi:hypothetical protein